MKPYDDRILEIGLPDSLQRDIDALKEGIKNKVGYIDCLLNEVQGSIDSLEVENLISKEQADYLYKKYLGR